MGLSVAGRKQTTIPAIPVDDRETRRLDNASQPEGNGLSGNGADGYMTTEEAARYMRRSVSWILRRKEIPYYRGKPNLYRREELDDWLTRYRRHEPKVT